MPALQTIEINRNGNKVIINQGDFVDGKDKLWVEPKESKTHELPEGAAVEEAVLTDNVPEGIVIEEPKETEKLKKPARKKRSE